MALAARQAPAQWDVVIVGAGPAGAALALRLRPRCRVLLLDRPPGLAPGAARIGESLPGAARVLLQRQGFYQRFLAQGHAPRGVSVSQWDSATPAWFDPIRDPHGVGWHLDRLRFDAGLREGAVAAGAALVDTVRHLALAREDGRWRIETHCLGPHGGPASRRTDWAPLVVDASGRGMALARQLGLARRGRDRLVCLYAHLPADAQDQDRATRLCADANGWWYSVRVPSGQRVLALHLDSDDAGLKALRDPRRFLERARRHALLAGIGCASMDFALRTQPAGGGGLDPDAVAALPDGFFAIGDAMLSFDPIASQGLFNALATADSCAHAIGRQLDGAAHARADYLEEMRAVARRYGQHLGATYGAVGRYARERFWQRRTAGDGGFAR
jgi:flavin-dependent dehydrogenase